jgi:hypothetical protein
MTAYVTMKRRQSVSAFVLTLLIFCSIGASAQPLLDFKRITLNWPTVELYFQASCNGKPIDTLKPADLRITENGNPVSPFTLWCPDTSATCPLSVSFVFDGSGSMASGSPTGNSLVKAFGYAFVSDMDGIVDQASVLWFNTMVSMLTEMTETKPVLNDAIDMIPANGGTAWKDGVYAGLQELVANGTNQCRAVVLITDGEDNSSTRSMTEVLSLANRYRIRVFTIAIGSFGDSTSLKDLAQQTGGTYYKVFKLADILSAQKSIVSIMRSQWLECVITYHADCMDGSTRTVDLSLLNVCGGDDVKSKIYRAPKDTTTYTPVHIGIPQVETAVNGTVDVPILLDEALSGAQFSTASFALLFDTSVLRLVALTAPPGSIYAGVNIVPTKIPGGTAVYLAAKSPLFTSIKQTPLLYATFHAVTSKGLDTLIEPVALVNWQFTSGCWSPRLSDGSVRIRLRGPSIVCQGVLAPASLKWNQQQLRYDPDSFAVRISVTNVGTLPANNAMFRVLFAPDFELLNPTQDTKAGTLANLNPGDSSSASWIIRAVRRTSFDSVQLCFNVSFDNHPPVFCCAKIWIPYAGTPAPRCSTSVEKIVFNAQSGAYDPMPFLVTTTVTNDGFVDLDSVKGTITLPPELKLAGIDAPDHFIKPLSSGHLTFGQSGSVTWLLWHDRTKTEQRYFVPITVKSWNGIQTACNVDVTIPPFPMPVLEPQCVLPDSLTFDNATGRLLPDTFDITLTCINTGLNPAQNVWAQLRLPPENVLADPADPLKKSYLPAVMNPYATGDPIAVVTWKARCIKPLIDARRLAIGFLLSGKDAVSLRPLDTLMHECSIAAPGVAASYKCVSLVQPPNPDSLIRTPDGLNLTPNPFTWTAGITNSGVFTSAIVKAEISFPSGDLAVDFSTPAVVLPAKLLRAGEKYECSWLVHAEPKTRLRSESIFVTFTDDRGASYICANLLTLQGVDALLSCLLNSDAHFLQFNPVSGKYEPKSWTLTDSLTNDGTLTLTNVQPTLTWTKPGGMDYVELDPTVPGNLNFRSLASLTPGQRASFVWALRLLKNNITPDTQSVVFSVAYTSHEFATLPSACAEYIDIGPTVATAVEGASPPSQFRLHQNHPNPFSANTSISYDLPSASFVIVTVHDLLGREIRRLVSMHQNAGHYVLPFDAGGLQTGMYLCRLSAGRFTETRRMTVVK